MSDFEFRQNQMLDHLYGLLDAGQVADLEAYLSSSPEGEALRQKAIEWKAQLAMAAKSEFPSVEFAPPMAKPTGKPLTVKPIMPAAKKSLSKPAEKRSNLAGWAIGISTLAVLLGFGIPVVRQSMNQMEQARLVRAKQADFATADREHNAFVTAYNVRRDAAKSEAAKANTQVEEINKEFAVALQKAREAVESKQFIVRLSGPDRAQPGAPNDWRVEMYKRDGAQTIPGKVEWAVKDQSGKELYRADSKGGIRGEPPIVSIPTSFWEKVDSNSELSLEVVAYENNLKSKVDARIPLARPVFITHLATDKPLYKQGETVYFRSLTLDRTTFTPPAKDMQIEFRMTKPGGQPEPIVVDGQLLRGNARGVLATGAEVVGPDKKALRGIGSGLFDIPFNAPGGEYTLSVIDVTPQIDEVRKHIVNREIVLETRKFNVIEYKPEIFDKTLEFDGKSYGAGDVVLVKCTASQTQGGKLKRGPVYAEASVDNQKVEVIHLGQTDDEGVVRLKLTLPKNITKGEGTISVTFSDRNNAEPITRPIPIVGRIINVEFFPEGGDLVAGVSNRVYFQATTHTGKPADIKGIITDGTETVAEVATLTDADQPGLNRGQGVFSLTPKLGKTYFLKVNKPLGIVEPPFKMPVSPRAVASGIGVGNFVGSGTVMSIVPTGFQLPKAKADGVVLGALDAVTNPDQPIRVKLQSATVRKTLVVGAYARGNLLDHQRVEVEPGKPVEVKLNPSVLAGGVTRLTVFEEKSVKKDEPVQLVPVAERLVYRKSAKQLLLNVQPDRDRYNPGSKVGLDVTAINESEKPVPAILMVAVVNQSVLTMADEKTGRLMPTHFLLASEVKKPEDLEHADFLLGEHPKAALGLDLLLGTQGWRRFAEQSAGLRRIGVQDDVDRMLVANGQKSLVPAETFREEERKVWSTFLGRSEAAALRQVDAFEANEEVQAEFFATVHPETMRLAKARDGAQREYQSALAKLRELEGDKGEARSMLFVRLCVGLLLITGVCIYLGAVRRGNASVGYFATAAGCFAVCGIALLIAAISNNSGDSQREVAQRDQKLLAPDGWAPEASYEHDKRPDAADGLPPAEGRVLEQAKQLADDMKGVATATGAVPSPKKAMFNAPGMPVAPPLQMAKPNIMRGMGDPRDGKGGLKADRLNGPPADFDKFGKNERMDAERQRDGRGDQLANNRRQNMLDGQLKFRQEHKEGLMKLKEAEAGFFLRPMQAGPLGGGFGGGGGLGGKGVMAGGGALANKDMAYEMDLEGTLVQLQRVPGLYIREYAFKKDPAPQGQPEERNNFAETVCWMPIVVTPDSGRADVHFQLSDSIARYQVLVAGHTLDGRIGAVTTHIEARKPFTVDPKVPIEVTASDRIDVPVRVVNDSDIRRAVTFRMTPNGLEPADASQKLIDGKVQDWLDLPANQKGRKVVSFRPTKKEGEASIMVLGTSNPVDAADQILRTFRIVPDGFPASGAVSDLLEKKANANFMLPEMVKGTLKVQVNVYPTTLADLQAGLESLMREPGGCFEQTSTSNYPNLLILDYLKSSDQAKPELAQRAKGLLDRGYNKLVAFECPKTGADTRMGFEWFGQKDRQHQALTAYGLLQFKDLSKAYPDKVDPELLKRTQKFLISQMKTDGGFFRDGAAIDTFGRAPDYITDAYIIWALVESDPEDKEELPLGKQFEHLKKLAKDHPQAKNDPYFLALVANSMFRRSGGGNFKFALELLDQIVEKNLKNGCVEGATTSITCSGGRDLQIETTALTVLALLRSGEPTRYMKPIKETTKWIGQQRGGYGGFGSTQSTILALKALIEHTKLTRKPAEAGEIRLTVKGKTYKKAFTEKDQEVITLDIEKPEEIFTEGQNEAVVEITTQQAYPFSLTWSCSTTTPLSSDKRMVDVETTIDKANAVEGETARIGVKLTNKVEQGHGMAVAIVGLPGGCRLPADLKELTKLREDGKISYFEIRGRELVLYWRSLKPSEQIELSFNVICEVPGEYAGPASRGYLYYNADHKHWVKPVKLNIAPAIQTGDEGVASK